jgi:hypothetical protein
MPIGPCPLPCKSAILRTARADATPTLRLFPCTLALPSVTTRQAYLPAFLVLLPTLPSARGRDPAIACTQMAGLSAELGCGSGGLDVMGGGVAEWRRERDRHLHLREGYAGSSSGAGGGGPGGARAQELLSLAAVLVRQALPLNFKVKWRVWARWGAEQGCEMCCRESVMYGIQPFAPDPHMRESMLLTCVFWRMHFGKWTTTWLSSRSLSSLQLASSDWQPRARCGEILCSLIAPLRFWTCSLSLVHAGVDRGGRRRLAGGARHVRGSSGTGWSSPASQLVDPGW